MLHVVFLFKLMLGSPCYQEQNSLTLSVAWAEELPVPGEPWQNQRDVGSQLRSCSDFVTNVKLFGSLLV